MASLSLEKRGAKPIKMRANKAEAVRQQQAHRSKRPVLDSGVVRHGEGHSKGHLTTQQNVQNGRPAKYDGVKSTHDDGKQVICGSLQGGCPELAMDE